MNIIHVIFNPSNGPLEGAIADFICFQNESENTRVSIICLGEKSTIEQQLAGKGIDVGAVDVQSKSVWAVSRELAKRLKAQKVDIVHSHNFGPLIYAGIAAKLIGKKAINTQYGSPTGRVSWLVWALYQYVVCISNYTRTAFSRHNRVSEAKLRTIHHGIGLHGRNGRVEPQVFRQKIGLSDRFTIGSVGPLSPESDYDTLLKAFAQLLRKEADAQLVIVGEGALKGKLQETAQNLGLSERISFVAPDQASIAIGASDVYVSSSFQKGRIFPILEAMAARKPVIATKIGEYPEIIQEAQTGHLVPCGFPERIEVPIMRFYGNRDLAKKLGDAGYERVAQQFNLSETIKQYFDLYKA